MCENNQATLVKCSSCITRFSITDTHRVSSSKARFHPRTASFHIIKPEKGETKWPKPTAVTYITYDNVVLNHHCSATQTAQDEIRRGAESVRPTSSLGAVVPRGVEQMRMSHQLLQGRQLLWEVAQARPVELQPAQTAHRLHMLREVATLRRGKRLKRGRWKISYVVLSAKLLISVFKTCEETSLSVGTCKSANAQMFCHLWSGRHLRF